MVVQNLLIPKKYNYILDVWWTSEHNIITLASSDKNLTFYFLLCFINIWLFKFLKTYSGLCHRPVYGTPNFTSIYYH